MTIAGHPTSISLEPIFWDMLKATADRAEQPISGLVAQIDLERMQSPTPPGLGTAIRLWLVRQLLNTEKAPEKAPDAS